MTDSQTAAICLQAPWERKGLEDNEVTRRISVSRSSHTWEAYGRNEKSGCLQLNPWDMRAGKAGKAELGADIAEAHERWWIECWEGRKGLQSDMFTERNIALFHSCLRLQQYILILFALRAQARVFPLTSTGNLLPLMLCSEPADPLLWPQWNSTFSALNLPGNPAPLTK